MMTPVLAVRDTVATGVPYVRCGRCGQGGEDEERSDMHGGFKNAGGGPPLIKAGVKGD
jgi:hypothetical protein